jgi:ABC-type uncharacterized transport system substrate-binding protein
MFKKTVFCSISFIFLLIILNSMFFKSVHAYADVDTKNILILNSYQKGLSWTDQETEGIIDAVKSESDNSVIAVEYMDWKNYPSQYNLIKLHDYLKYKYAQRKLDLVVTTDDAALEFALKNREEMLSNAPVVFCGVNQEGVNNITRGYTNVTGVVEQIDPEKTISAAVEINPDIREIYLLYDNTESGESTGDLTINIIKRINPGIKITSLNDVKLEDIIKKVKEAPEDSAVLITTYYQDIDGNVVGLENFCRIISENSRVPVYDLYDFAIGHGAVGGSMLSGKMLGQSAGRIASRVLCGEDISGIPADLSVTARYIFDYQ